MVTRVWCDVGGTFTDTIVQTQNHAGSLTRTRLKVLSSGRTPARILEWQSNSRIETDLETAIPKFWCSAKLEFHDSIGNKIGTAQVVGYKPNHSILELDTDVPDSIRSSAVSIDLIAGCEAPVLAMRLLTNRPLTKPIVEQLDIRLGTTRGTNALLTRSGSRVAFVTTEPFCDLLVIGNQDRPSLFELEVSKRKPLYETVIGIAERIQSDGSVELQLDTVRAREQLRELAQLGIESLAVCLMNSYANAKHERAIGEIAREFNFKHITLSSQISPVAKFVDRSETAVMDAYLSPVVKAYLNKLREQFGEHSATKLRVMTSSGGLVDYQQYSGKDSVLSGPAGGVIALQRLSEGLEKNGPQKLIGLDMGGTSTDVARVQGRPTIQFESIKADIRLLTPSLDIHTVAAGGGSICTHDGTQWHIGPDSAGALPGPACYGLGGPLTVTDLNVLTGRLPMSALPFEINRLLAEQRLETLAIRASVPSDSYHALAEGLRQIANEQMAAAVRAITIAQGTETSDHILVGFGGAAGQHICQVADILGIDTVLDPADAGIMSAMGMGLAPVSRTASLSIYRDLNECTNSFVSQLFETLIAQTTEQLDKEFDSTNNISFDVTLEVRTTGTDRTIAVPWKSVETVASDFHRLHMERYGYSRPDLPVEIAIANLVARIQSDVKWKTPTSTERETLREIASIESSIYPRLSSDTRASSHQLYCGDKWLECKLYQRNDLSIGQVIDGPAIAMSPSHTIVVDNGWVALVCHDGSLLIGKKTSAVSSSREGASNRLVYREVLAQRFGAIASQMGIVLEQTAISVNIRDRRDFSCAVFDNRGNLLANAPHVPVHLGAMQATVQYALENFPSMRPGDSFITNDPQCGGSHLPDITVITPVFCSSSNGLIFLVANRAHHAEIGGLAPGSMAPNSTKLVQEGVIIEMQYLTRGERDCYAEVQSLLETAPYPSRLPNQNMADISAQAAANQRGATALQSLALEMQWTQLQEAIDGILDATESKVHNWIESLSPRVCSFEDELDDGTAIVVSMSFVGNYLHIDFAGTGPVSHRNFNAGPGIVHAAVMYTIRTLMTDVLPMNSGTLRPIQISIPHSLLNPGTTESIEERPAVAAGNVETSQRIVDVLLGAMGVCGASQGTMNNFLMGNQRFGFYETLGGGTGATINSAGSSAVHSHMTNTRLTDPEVLEQRYPVRLRQLKVRTASGGIGKHCGGDGMVREMQFLEDLQVSLITSRRQPYAPYGQAGGQPGMCGRNILIDCSGTESELPACAQLNVRAGQRIRIETPGGGGFGTIDLD